MGETPSGWVWKRSSRLFWMTRKKRRATRICCNFAGKWREFVLFGSAYHGASRLGVLSRRATPHHYAEVESHLYSRWRGKCRGRRQRAEFRTSAGYQRQLAQERDRLRVLLEVNNAIISKLDLRGAAQRNFRFPSPRYSSRYTSLALFEDDKNKMRVMALDFPQGKGLIHEKCLCHRGVIAGSAFETAPGGSGYSAMGGSIRHFAPDAG